MRSALPTLQFDPALARHGAVLDVARAILEGFDKHYRLFREITRTAQKHFEEADWIAIQQATRERIRFYDLRVREAVERLKQEFQADSLDDTIWQRVKVQYVGLLADHKQPECAETFFNSVCCKILQRTYFHNNFIFVRPAVSTEHIDSDPPSYRCYYPRKSGLHETLVRILDDFGLKRPFADLNRDLRYVIHAWKQYLPNAFDVEANHQIQVLGSLFFRNKAAYLVGKIINGNHDYPFVVPILHDPDGRLYLDTVLVDPDQLAILFSSSRAYFLVDMEVPSAYVQFLCGMLPNKPKAELYTILGLQKQGKTLFYRDFLHHLKNSSDEFIIAPGIKGLVMLVFTLPSYPYVFKVIKDVIAPPKHVTREKVKEKYLLVKYHDRVGRMADTLEYSDVAFPKARFTAELLTELRTLAPSVIEDEGETLIVKHLYIERRMIPLNIYLERADDKQRAHAVREVGTAIKQLAAANIFPGDLLFKNFGMTRHDRVIFYDYDEIDYLTNCKFRQMPSPRHEEDELSAEPWFSVDPHDVFPEEFATFLLVNPQVREHFLAYHGDILTAQFWQAIQQRIAAGNIEDVFPYPEPLRFCNSFRATDL